MQDKVANEEKIQTTKSKKENEKEEVKCGDGRGGTDEREAKNRKMMASNSRSRLLTVLTKS